MLQTRSPKSFTNTSKKFNRRVQVSFEATKYKLRRFFPILILIPLVFLINSLFIVRKINCTLNSEVCPKETQAVLNKLLGTNSFFVNQKEILTCIKAIYPIDSLNIGYKIFNTLNVDLKGSSPFVQANIFLVNKLPTLSMDQAPSTTDSASWWIKPTGELKVFISTENPQGFNLWDNGSMTSTATTGAVINYIFSEKPTPETISSIYKMYRTVIKYIDVSNIYIVNKRSFLSRQGEPDIIIGVPFDEGSLISALQSINYLSTIKKDAKVIDLSFKNPIIR